MAQWSGSDSGILRKTHTLENHNELLVFGYACKLFRDDEKALYIDQGKHLIPWMGDDKLKIDRYDCRGALSDLRNYEASREGFHTMRWLGLSDKERQLEELCDKERYYSLEMNEEEEEMYKEEEEKRRKMNAIQYSYDVPQDPNKVEPEGIPTVEQAEEEYIPPPILDVPVDIAIPQTVKENARIEKTAMFVCRQGPQMEILIKAKQGSNPHFSFLNQNDKLYKFYRHVLAAFKNGRYQGYGPEPLNKTESSDDADPDSGSHYLHPSLLSTSSQQGDSTPTQSVQIPQIPFKPSVNCTYSQLVNRIQGNQLDTTAQDAQKANNQAAAEQFFGQLTYEQQQYYQYYYMQQYYEYYKQMAMYQQDGGANAGQLTPPSDFRNLDPSIQSYIQQLAYSQYIQQVQQQQQQQQAADNNSYAQIVSNVNKDGNTYSANLPEIPTNIPQSENNLSGQNSPSLVKNEPIEKKENDAESANKAIVQKPLLSLATAYGSDSESYSDDSSDSENCIEERKKETPEETKEIYKIPTGELQLVIDKMAVYVSKNGDQFEDIIRAKKDPRFEFLEEAHEFNKYYKEKLRDLKGETKPVQVEKKTEKEKQVEDKREVTNVKEKDVREVKIVKKEKKVIAPVSFSIKKPKEDPPKEIKSALPIEESDEEETENSATPSTTSTSQSSNSLSSILTKYSESQQRKEPKEVVVNKTDNGTSRSKESSNKENYTKQDGKLAEANSKKNGLLDGDDPLMEIIELTGENGGDKRDSKRAEDKIKDKLALAAREKLAAITKDKALQLERKRRAAAFLKQKMSETSSISTIDLLSDKSKSPPSRRDSVEIIDDSAVKERLLDPRIIDTINLDRSSSNERETSDKKSAVRDRDRSRSVDVKNKSKKKKEKRSRRRSRSRSRSREKEKRRKRSSSTEDDDEEYRKKSERKDRKKSHKRKHSKHRSKNKKKSKKRSRRSNSASSMDSDTS